MGLLNAAFAGGAAQGVSEIGKQMTAYGMSDTLAQRETAAKEAMAKRLADYQTGIEAIQHTRDRKEQEADQGTKQTNELALIKARSDPNERKISKLKLKALMEDAKIPSSVKTKYATLDTTLKAQQSALFKAQSEGTFEAASPGAISLQENIKNTKNEMSTLIDPYLPEAVKPKKGEVDPDNPLGLNLPPLTKKDESATAKAAAASPQAYDPVAHLLDPSNVTPYADKLKALMDMQPPRSAPQAEQAKWQAVLVRLKASQNAGTGLINRSM